MGIEKLSAAARAAGYAMANSEDLLTRAPHQPVSELNPWQSLEIKQSIGQSNNGSSWALRRTIYSLFGWNATA